MGVDSPTFTSKCQSTTDKCRPLKLSAVLVFDGHDLTGLFNKSSVLQELISTVKFCESRHLLGVDQ